MHGGLFDARTQRLTRPHMPGQCKTWWTAWVILQAIYALTAAMDGLYQHVRMEERADTAD